MAQIVYLPKTYKIVHPFRHLIIAIILSQLLDCVCGMEKAVLKQHHVLNFIAILLLLAILLDVLSTLQIYVNQKFVVNIYMNINVLKEYLHLVLI